MDLDTKKAEEMQDYQDFMEAMNEQPVFASDSKELIRFLEEFWPIKDNMDNINNLAFESGKRFRKAFIDSDEKKV